jgi:hypothetical protein
MAINLRPMSFHCSSTASAGRGAGFGVVSFLGISCARASIPEIAMAKISAASEPAFFMDVFLRIWAVETGPSYKNLFEEKIK